MGEHGWFDIRFMYEESFRIPMVMRYPALIKAGTTNESMVMYVDLAPTLLDYSISQSHVALCIGLFFPSILHATKSNI